MIPSRIFVSPRVSVALFGIVVFVILPSLPLDILRSSSRLTLIHIIRPPLLYHYVAESPERIEISCKKVANFRGPKKGTATEKSPLGKISRKLANSPETVRYCGLMWPHRGTPVPGALTRFKIGFGLIRLFFSNNATMQVTLCVIFPRAAIFNLASETLCNVTIFNSVSLRHHVAKSSARLMFLLCFILTYSKGIRKNPKNCRAPRSIHTVTCFTVTRIHIWCNGNSFDPGTSISHPRGRLHFADVTLFFA